MDTINLRPTRPADLKFVLAAERHPDNAPYVNQWSLQQHEDAIAFENSAHFIVEKSNIATDSAGQSIHSQSAQSIGYVILIGLHNPHRSLLLKRIVILSKGKGFGRKTLQWIKAFTFEQMSYHRLELEVFSNNKRAQYLYRSEGFIDEGRLRDAIKTPQGYEDLLLLSILEDEYQSKAHNSIRSSRSS